MRGSCIAVDWGTTNARAYRIEAGAVTGRHGGVTGAATMPSGGYDDAVAGVRTALGDLPMLLIGMVGSTIGWREVPYVTAPADLAALGAGITWIDARTGIVPGIAFADGPRGDVMRGEETQILGALAAGLLPREALVCQPGTHAKWVGVEAGRIARCTTAMTGELFALLRGHSILKPQLAGQALPDASFRDGVIEGARRDLSASLFGIRAAALLGMRDDARAASFASGLLIGADVGCRIGEGEVVHLLADPLLGALYRAAIETLGGRVVPIDSEAAFVAGAWAVWEQGS